MADSPEPAPLSPEPAPLSPEPAPLSPEPAPLSSEPAPVLSDDELLRVLALVLDETESVPDDLVLAARSALTWRTIETELAELLYDSALDPEPVLVRDPAVARLLAFSVGELGIDVEIQGGELVGSVSPPGSWTIELQQPAGSSPAEAHSDDVGMFRLSGVRPGPARLVLRGLSGRDELTTPWVVI